MATTQDVPRAGERSPSDDDRRRRLVTRVGGGGLLALGLLLFRGFGIPWDEDLMHNYGELLLRFFTTGDRAWENFVSYPTGHIKLYGPVVAVPQAIIDRWADSPYIGYRYGHLLVFLIFAGSVFAFYGLCRRHFKSWRWGAIGAAMLVLSPRIFTHAFVNNRDIPFMAFIVITLYFVARFIESRRVVWMVAAGAASALTIDVRVGGVFVVGLAFLFLGLDVVGDVDFRASLRRLVVPVAVYLGVAGVLTVAFWPYLWANPIARFIEVLRFFGDFTVATPKVLYRGQVVSVIELPWHFIPWWIAISTPIPYLLLTAVGFTTIAVRRWRAVFQTRSNERYLYMYAVWLGLPLALVIVGRSPVYDDWRHLMFVYPALVFFAVAGARRIYERLRHLRYRISLRRAWAVALVAILCWVAGTMIRFHPFENVYFNALAGGAEGRYEMDYGGLSYKQGLEYLLHTQQGPVRVTACTRPGFYANLLFAQADWTRLVYVPPEQADYALCAPLGGLGISAVTYFPGRPMIYSINRGSGTFFFIKRLR